MEPSSEKEPRPDEPICVVTYELVAVRLGAGPDQRPSFWKHYRDELKYNQQTRYKNDRIRIATPVMISLKKGPPKTPVYFRDGALNPNYFAD